MTTVEQQIEELMDRFRFDQVQLTMETLDWKWAFAAYGVPSVEELRACARSLLKDAAAMLDEHNTSRIETGGLAAHGERIGKDIYLRLFFYVDSRETFN